MKRSQHETRNKWKKNEREKTFWKIKEKKNVIEMRGKKSVQGNRIRMDRVIKKNALVVCQQPEKKEEKLLQ